MFVEDTEPRQRADAWRPCLPGGLGAALPGALLPGQGQFPDRPCLQEKSGSNMQLCCAEPRGALTWEVTQSAPLRVCALHPQGTLGAKGLVSSSKTAVLDTERDKSEVV